jgi:phosphoglycolate phosphatase
MNVLLDLDGTLTDSRPGILACIQHALEALGEPRAEEVDLHRFIGPPLRDTFAELLRVEVDHDRVEAAISAYRDRFASAGMFENAVYEHIPQALAELAASGANLFVATSKLRVFAERILEHFDLTGHFVAVYGSELDGSRTNKAELIAYAMQRSQLDPTDTVMVGDRSHDILGGTEASKSWSRPARGACWHILANWENFSTLPTFAGFRRHELSRDLSAVACHRDCFRYYVGGRGATEFRKLARACRQG